METPNWDDYFMTMVYLTASKSKDKKTHIGAVVVDDLNVVRSLGYNGFPRGLNDNIPERQERPEKYYWMVHAEVNAIYNARTDLRGCRMYTNGVPCAECAKGVIQSGIREVIVDYEWDKDNSDKWRENAERASQMFQEVGVNVRYYKGHFMGIEKFKNGISVPLL